MKLDLRTRLLSLVMVLFVFTPGVAAKTSIDQDLLKGLSARSIGPAGVGGRISAIDAVASNPNRIVIGAATGGVWISNSGGLTWEPVFDEEAVASIGALAINQSNPDIIWVGTGESNVRNSTSIGGGVYKSVDGGKTWRLSGLPNSERIDRITLHPDNPDIVYVAALGTLWGPNEERGVYKTVDGGESWQRILYNDGGDSFAVVNDEYDVADRPFYYSEISVDPQNADRVYNIATNVRLSIDGGKNFEKNPVVVCCAAGNSIHIDNHAFWINPGNPQHMILGNDGGLAITRDGGQSWRFVRNLPLAQFYHVALDNELPYNVYGGLQDNGSWRGPSAVWKTPGIKNQHWLEVGFGDGFETRPDPENARRGYTMSQGGYLTRWNLDTGEQRFIRPEPPNAETELRFNWNAAFAQDPFDPATIYYGSQFIHKSEDRGESWTVISADLSSNDPELQKYKESGGITYDVTAAENYTSITAVAPSNQEQGVLWVGTDDGRVHITRDGGSTWQRIDERARGVEKGAWVPSIAPSPHHPGTAFIAFDDHRRGNMETYVFRVDDYGRRWTALATQQLSGYALSVLPDPEDPNLLFLGTEFGLYFSSDAGKNWSKFTAGVPTVSVMDMAKQQEKDGDKEQLEKLGEEAAELSKTLDALEKRFRTPPQTKGIVYENDKVSNVLGDAEYYLYSSKAVPTRTVRTYIEKAQRTLNEATAAVNEFMAGELAEFRSDVEASGIGLLRSSEPL